MLHPRAAIAPPTIVSRRSAVLSKPTGALYAGFFCADRRVDRRLWRALGCGARRPANAAFFAEIDRLLGDATTRHLAAIGDPRALLTILAAPGAIGSDCSPNDAEMTARAHLRKLGLDDVLEFVAGYDSGFGAKPDAGAGCRLRAGGRRACFGTAVVGDLLLDLAAVQRRGRYRHRGADRPRVIRGAGAARRCAARSAGRIARVARPPSSIIRITAAQGEARLMCAARDIVEGRDKRCCGPTGRPRGKRKS